MKRTISAQKALKLLNIPDFRHLTKDKIVEFSSLLYRMDPEVAKKALEQIPEYVKLASEMVRTYKEVIDKMFEANAVGTKAFYDACNGILSTLAAQLLNADITPEERNSLNDRMITVAQMIALIVFMVLDYITGLMCAIMDKKLSSTVGFRGICKKALILMLVGVANILDVHVIGTGSALRGAVVCFYLSNEGLSLLENAAHIGLPVPEKLKDVLAQLHNRNENNEDEN